VECVRGLDKGDSREILGRLFFFSFFFLKSGGKRWVPFDKTVFGGPNTV
jgi:hypothetical protein